jgi:ATP-dependent Clp protease protease subunit
MSELVNNLPQPLPRKLYLTGEVSDTSVNNIIKEIFNITTNDENLSKLMRLSGYDYTPKPIEIYIDSPGGWVTSGLGLCDVILNSKTPIHTITLGLCASMGFVISLCGTKRFCYKNSSLMYHQASSWNIGKIQEQTQHLEVALELQKKIDYIVTSRTNIKQSKLDKVNKNKKDWWMFSDEALKLGVVDEII